MKKFSISKKYNQRIKQWGHITQQYIYTDKYQWETPVKRPYDNEVL